MLVGVRASEEGRTDALIGGLELLAVGIRDARIAPGDGPFGFGE